MSIWRWSAGRRCEFRRCVSTQAQSANMHILNKIKHNVPKAIWQCRKWRVACWLVAAKYRYTYLVHTFRAYDTFSHPLLRSHLLIYSRIFPKQQQLLNYLFTAPGACFFLLSPHMLTLTRTRTHSLRGICCNVVQKIKSVVCKMQNLNKLECENANWNLTEESVYIFFVHIDVCLCVRRHLPIDSLNLSQFYYYF